MIFKTGFLRFLFLFLLGGYLYCILEVLFRGHSHISMLFAGGICFTLIGSLYEMMREKRSTVFFLLMGMCIITAVELCFGIVCNIYMKLNVWDYSMYKYNYKGQICLYFSCCWFGISYFIIKFFHIIICFLDQHAKYAEIKPNVAFIKEFDLQDMNI